MRKIILALLFIGPIAASESSVEPVRLYFTNNPVQIADGAGLLTMSGDCIANWEYYRTRSQGRKLRGSGAYDPSHAHLPIPTSLFLAQVDLVFEYTADPTYSMIQFEFQNDCGIQEPPGKKKKNDLAGSGLFNDIELLQAFMGYHVVDRPTHSLDIEIGRRRLFDIFDSKIQFDNLFDGLTFSYGHSNNTWGDFKTILGGFVTDNTVNHIGYVGELDFLGIRGSQLDIKYSLISWTHRGHNRYNKRNPLGARFLNSQLLAVYGLPELFSKDPSIYLAGLHNHAAKGNRLTHHKKAANAFYGGLTVGQVKKKNDWSLDVNYQWVQAQAIPEDDVAGIGRDNPTDVRFYKHNWGGQCNYKGYIATFVFGLTDNLSLSLIYQKEREQSRKIGGKYRSSSFQVSSTYYF